jgi:hypothetical protein
MTRVRIHIFLKQDGRVAETTSIRHKMTSERTGVLCLELDKGSDKILTHTLGSIDTHIDTDIDMTPSARTNITTKTKRKAKARQIPVTN